MPVDAPAGHKPGNRCVVDQANALLRWVTKIRVMKDHSGVMKDCIAFICHVWNAPVRAVFERMQREVPSGIDVRFVLSSNDRNADVTGLQVESLDRITLEDLFSLGYPQK